MSRGAGFRFAGTAVLALLAVALLVALTEWVGLGSLTNPESEIITQLKRTERDGLTLPLGTGMPALVAARHHFDRITVRLDLPEHQAMATSTLDLDGKVGEIRVSSLGLERTPFVERQGRWSPADGDAPLLRDALAALEGRRRALEQDGPAALAGWVTASSRARALGDPRLVQWLAIRHRRYQVRAWYVRTERERVVVTEEYRLEGDTPDRPVDEEGRRRLELVREGGRLLFDGALL